MSLRQKIVKAIFDLAIDRKTGETSPQKLAVSTSYFVGTVCFIWFHFWLFAESTDIAKVSVGLGAMPFLWFIYFGIIGGHHYLLERIPKEKLKDVQSQSDDGQS